MKTEKDFRFEVHLNEQQLDAILEFFKDFGEPELAISWTDKEGNKQRRQMTVAELSAFEKFKDLL